MPLEPHQQTEEPVRSCAEARIAELEAELAAERANNERLWGAVNRRRGRLIEWQNTGSLTQADAEELTALQAVADAHLSVVAPHDETTLTRLEAEAMKRLGREEADDGD